LSLQTSCSVLRANWAADTGTYVRNITDIDDKIIPAGTAERGEPIAALTERFIGYMREDLGRARPADAGLEPRRTPNMCLRSFDLIDGCRARAPLPGGRMVTVKFRLVSQPFPNYGRLSHRTWNGTAWPVTAGRRLGSKRDPLDLRCCGSHARPEEAAMAVTLGAGRPGWSISMCSSMGGRRWQSSPFEHFTRASTPDLISRTKKTTNRAEEGAFGIPFACVGCTAGLAPSATTRCPSRLATS